ncbi:SWF or SNF family helicase [Streptomyces sp. NPDC091292]|uniref:SWF or SNF family helicase n=1 Tax=Streptomyces sp. NPDC091292 TaxID=3365991 RepID=UPI00380FBA30
MSHTDDFGDDRIDRDPRSYGDEAPYERERTFAALPPARGRGFAQTWWGQTWLKALEDTALDSAQLKTGRALARAGAVGAVSVRPGRITAVVQDRDGTRHRADVLWQRLTDEEWGRFLDMAVQRAGHIAALLDRDMPPHLVEDASDVGVELLPAIGDLEPECNCEAWDHCAHTAALCYHVGRLLDQDPFVLLLLRGRDERTVLDELQVRSITQGNATSADETEYGQAGDDEQEEGACVGVDAVEAFAAENILPPLPDPPPLPLEPGLPPSLDTDAQPAPGVDPEALEFLALQAAVEAHRLLSDALSPRHERLPVEADLTPEQDAVRLAAGRPGARATARLADGSGRDAEGIARAIRAWIYGGRAALAVLEDAWVPDPEAMARARAVVEGAWDDDERPPLGVESNRWTTVGAEQGDQVRTQVRFGRDGRWWPYREERGHWAPAGPAAHDPATALATARGDD